MSERESVWSNPFIVRHYDMGMYPPKKRKRVVRHQRDVELVTAARFCRSLRKLATIVWQCYPAFLIIGLDCLQYHSCFALPAHSASRDGTKAHLPHFNNLMHKEEERGKGEEEDIHVKTLQRVVVQKDSSQNQKWRSENNPVRLVEVQPAAQIELLAEDHLLVASGESQKTTQPAVAAAKAGAAPPISLGTAGQPGIAAPTQAAGVAPAAGGGAAPGVGAVAPLAAGAAPAAVAPSVAGAAAPAAGSGGALTSPGLGAGALSPGTPVSGAAAAPVPAGMNNLPAAGAAVAAPAAISGASAAPANATGTASQNDEAQQYRVDCTAKEIKAAWYSCGVVAGIDSAPFGESTAILAAQVQPDWLCTVPCQLASEHCKDLMQVSMKRQAANCPTNWRRTGYHTILEDRSSANNYMHRMPWSNAGFPLILIVGFLTSIS